MHYVVCCTVSIMQNNNDPGAGERLLTNPGQLNIRRIIRL